LPWGLEIDSEHRPDRYLDSATFHPTFLYEILWNLALAALLVWLGRHRSIRPPGLFALYVAGYSLGRIGEELLRVDPAHHILGLRLNFFVAALLFVGGLAWFAAIQTGRRISWRSPRRGAGLFAVGAALCVCGCGGAHSRGSAAYADANTVSMGTPMIWSRRVSPSSAKPRRSSSVTPRTFAPPVGG
jgi:hypothetical protein